MPSVSDDNLRNRAAALHSNVPPDWYERSVHENILQKFWHSVRAQNIIKYSQKVSGRILDIGSADGYFTNIILGATDAKKVTGIDVLQSSVDYASKRYRYSKKLTFTVGDAHNLRFGTSVFDAVYSLESLEHVIDPEKVIKEIYRVLKPNGYTIILVPYENLLFKVIWFFWTKGKGKVWDGTHLQNFSPSSLSAMLKKQKFKNISTHRFLLGMLLLVKAYK